MFTYRVLESQYLCTLSVYTTYYTHIVNFVKHISCILYIYFYSHFVYNQFILKRGKDMGNFKNVFKQLRIAVGFTQSEMAEKLGISKSTISMYENGNREPDFETLEKIADFFNVDIDYLLGRTEKTTVLPETAAKYYLNDDTAQVAQEIFENKDLRVLFDAARDAKPEDLRTTYDMLMALKRKERGNDDTGC